MKNATQQGKSINLKGRVTEGNLVIPLAQLGRYMGEGTGTGARAQRGRPRKTAGSATS